MFSLILWSARLVSQFLIGALVIAWGARACGSTRGRFAVAVRAQIILFVLAIGIFFGFSKLLDGVLKQSPGIGMLATLLTIFVSQFTALVIFKEMFKLSWGRAFGPWGASLAIEIIYGMLLICIVEPRFSQSFVIPTNSMNPTLVPGDRFFVNKVVAPRRWDLVAYHSNGRGSPVFCKRLLGLPGERIRFDGERLYINDRLEESPSALHGHYAGRSTGMRLVQDGKTLQLGPGEFFFIGDDLDNSFDSRLEGPTDRANLVGVAELLYWPFTRAGFLRK
jgi:signal peptidase I